MIAVKPIRQAMRARILAASGLSSVAKAWTNRVFTPPNPAALWMRESFMPAVERKAATATLVLDAIFQYDVFDGVGKGEEDAEAIAEIIGNLFLPGTGISGAGVQVELVRTEKLQGREAGMQGNGSSKDDRQVWYMVPVRVTIRAYGTI